jgi:hypothetical protein
MISLPSTAGNPLGDEIQNFYNLIAAEYARLNNLLNLGSVLVWNNDTGATPQTVVSTMGTCAGSVFTLSAMLCQLIGTIRGNAPNPVPTGWGVTINADNTVTLTPPTST